VQIYINPNLKHHKPPNITTLPPPIGGGMAKAGVGFSLGQDFINIFLLVLCKKIL